MRSELRLRLVIICAFSILGGLKGIGPVSEAAEDRSSLLLRVGESHLDLFLEEVGFILLGGDGRRLVMDCTLLRKIQHLLRILSHPRDGSFDLLPLHNWRFD